MRRSTTSLFAVTNLRTTLVYLCVFLGHYVLDVYSKICSLSHSNSLGWTEPGGDIILEVGNPLEIFCILNEDDTGSRKSEDIVFIRDGKPLDSRFVTVINKTTTKLRIENMTESSNFFYCALKMENQTKDDANSLVKIDAPAPSEFHTICGNLVAVGTAPKEVENFNCISYNFTALVCRWTAPVNYVSTNYTVSYLRPGRPGRGIAYPCPTHDDVKHNFCRWEGSEYRRNFQYLNMKVTGSNQFGIHMQNIDFHHVAHIVPPKPKNLELITKTPTSIFFKWNVGEMRYYTLGILYRVQYTRYKKNQPPAPWTTQMYSSKDLPFNDKGFVFVNVTDLKPYTLYNFRISMKTEHSIGDEYWSEPGAEIFRTMACAPFVSPKTDVGSFETEITGTGRHMFVYWKPLPDSDFNGDDFKYEVKAYKIADDDNEVEDKHFIAPLNVNYSFAEFEVDFDAYRVLITSVNKEGAANHSSVVQIPSQKNSDKYFRSFTKTDFGNGVYELAWELSHRNSTSDPVFNVTLFWCESIKERPFQCNGDIDWEHFRVDVSKHNVTLNASLAYQFAISANMAHLSSGMFWAQCTIVHGRLGVIKNLRAEDMGQHYINLSWMLDCHSQTSIIEGYRIFYCVVDTDSSTGGDGHDRVPCRDEERNVTIPGDMHVTSGQLANLDVNTSYRITMSILTQYKHSPSRSAELVARTSEGPPDMTDVKVRVLNTTNTTARIEWNAPKVTNGKLRGYKLNYCCGHEKLAKENETSAILKDLTSYTEYNVTLKACTSECSLMTPWVSFKTDIGVPGVVEGIETNLNDSHVMIHWNIPKIPAGPNPLYEVAVEENETLIKSYFTSATEITVPIPDCSGEKTRGYIKFKVRAMNGPLTTEAKTDSADYKYVGNWSSANSVNCSGGGVAGVYKVLAFIFLPLLSALTFIYVGRKLIYRCKQMKSVQVTIPIKFTMPPPAYAPDIKGHHDLFDSYTSVSQIKSPDECRNLVEKSTEFVH